jgi:hypothetical protein
VTKKQSSHCLLECHRPNNKKQDIKELALSPAGFHSTLPHPQLSTHSQTNKVEWRITSAKQQTAIALILLSLLASLFFNRQGELFIPSMQSILQQYAVALLSSKRNECKRANAANHRPSSSLSLHLVLSLTPFSVSLLSSRQKNNVFVAS